MFRDKNGNILKIKLHKKIVSKDCKNVRENVQKLNLYNIGHAVNHR